MIVILLLHEAFCAKLRVTNSAARVCSFERGEFVLFSVSLVYFIRTGGRICIEQTEVTRIKFIRNEHRGLLNDLVERRSVLLFGEFLYI